MPDGFGGVVTDTLSVPLGGGDKKSQIVALLSKLRPGEYQSGKSLGADIDLDHTGGHFYRLMAELKTEGKVESNKSLGYRLKQ